MSEVATVEQPKEERSASSQMIEVIERVSTNPQVDVDKMKALLDMQERILDRQNEQEFNAAMIRAQKRMPTIAAKAFNEQTKSHYAKLDAVVKAITPVYTEEGLALSFSQDESPVPEHIRVVADIYHESGFKVRKFLDMPISTTGLAGKPNMTKPHAQGSGFSYGRRYLTLLIFNLATGDDNDGNTPRGNITDEQAAELKALIEETGSDTVAFLKAMGGAASVDELPADKYNPALVQLNRKLKKQREQK